MITTDTIKNLDMLTVGKLKLLLADIPNDYQIAIACDGHNEVTNNVKVDIVSDDFGYIVFGGYPASDKGYMHDDYLVNLIPKN